MEIKTPWLFPFCQLFSNTFLLFLVLSLSLMTASCSSGPPQEAQIFISFETQSVDSGCISQRCDDYPMSCGATLYLRITDPVSGAQLFDTSGNALKTCLSASPSETLCDLKELAADMQLTGMPAQTVRVEVALWNQDQLSPDDCPSPSLFELFDPQGRPQNSFPIQPAFAGAAYFRAGEESDITVPLFCPNPSLLSIDTCEANLPAQVEAMVTSMQRVDPIRKEEAPTLAIAVGQTRELTDDVGDSFHVLEANDTLALRLDNQNISPVFRGTLSSRLGQVACTTTLAGTPQAATSVVCENVPSNAAQLNLRPIWVSKEIVDAVLLALGQGDFPKDGIVIGRVVNENSSPAANVTLSPSHGSVQYLSEDLSSLNTIQSSNSGYFISTDTPFDTTWTASHLDGRHQIGTPRGGRIQGKVSALIIRMSGEVIGP